MKMPGGIALMVMSCFCINAYALSFDAVIDFPPRVGLSLPVPGLVNKVEVSAGQHVKKGEPLVSLDETPFKADKVLMQASVTFHQARLTESTRDLKHQQELFDRTVLSTVELENAELRVKRDSALLESAKARLARADYAFSNSQLKAPFDALIMTVQVNEGQAINNALQTETLVSLVRQGYFIARFNVTAAQLEKMKVETPVKVVIGGTRYMAKISAISYEPVPFSKGAGLSVEKRYRVDAGFYTQSDSIPVGKQASVVID